MTTRKNLLGESSHYRKEVLNTQRICAFFWCFFWCFFCPVLIKKTRKHSMPARRPPENVRLPGPHYVLEQALDPPGQDQRRNRSAPVVLSRQQVQSASDGPITSHNMTASQERPDIPCCLYQARGQQPLGSTPSSLPQSYIPSQSFPIPHPGPHLFSNDVSAPGSAWSGAVGGAHRPAYNPPLVYDRARGNETAALAPMLPGPSPASAPIPEEFAYYQRAGGKKLPFPNDLNPFTDPPGRH